MSTATSSPPTESTKNPKSKPQSSSSPSSPPLPSPLIDSALHVLKYSLFTVLGSSFSQSSKIELLSSTRCTLITSYAGDATLSEDIIRNVENIANEIIQKNVPITTLKIDQKSAEEKHSHHSEVTGEVDMVLIENVNAHVYGCGGNHFSSTKDIISLAIQKPKYRKSTQQYEFTFVCGPTAMETLKKQKEIDMRKDKTKALEMNNNEGNKTKSASSPSPSSSSPSLPLSPLQKEAMAKVLAHFQSSNSTLSSTDLESDSKESTIGISNDEMISLMKSFQSLPPKTSRIHTFVTQIKDIVDTHAVPSSSASPSFPHSSLSSNSNYLLDSSLTNLIQMIYNEAYTHGYRACKDFKEPKTADTLLPDF